MASLQRLLTRKPQIDEAELEFVRSRTIERLAALSETDEAPDAIESDAFMHAANDLAASPVASDDVITEGPVATSETIALGPPAEAAPTDVLAPNVATETIADDEASPEPETAPIPELHEVPAPATATTATTRATTKKTRQPKPKPKRTTSKPEPAVVPVMAEPSSGIVTDGMWPSEWARAAKQPAPVEPAGADLRVAPDPIRQADTTSAAEADAIEAPANEAPTAEVLGRPDRDPSRPVPRYAAIQDDWDGHATAAGSEATPIVPTLVDPVVPIIDPRRTPRQAPRPAHHRSAVVKRAAPARPTIQPQPLASTFCPYCALALDPPPTSSRRCARCRQRIVVKRVQGRVVYLTEAAVEVFESERLRSANFGRWSKERAQWLKLARTVHADPDRIARLDAAPLSERVVESARSLYLSTTERSFREAKRDDRWEDASRLKRDQAAAMYRLDGLPVPPSDAVLALHREAVSVELRGIGKMAKEAGLVGSTCCDICRADDGRAFRIATERKASRLPHEGCPKGLCHCRWDLAFRDETMVRRYLKRKTRSAKAARATG
jgi:hypothetical protein